MADDIRNAKATTGVTGSTAFEVGTIKNVTVVVQAPRKTFGTNNFIDEAQYTSYNRASGVHPNAIDKIKDKYDGRFDDFRYYTGDSA